MTATILKIIFSGSKLIFMLLRGVIKRGNAEELKRFEERLRTLSTALKEAVSNKEESLNEEAYLSNLEWEKKQRYTAYKAKFLEIVKAGGGYVELSSVSSMAMGTKVSQKKDAIIEILSKDMPVEDKSKIFAKLLAETA